MVHPNNSGFTVRIFFKILRNEKGQSVDESGINNFPKKKIVWGKWTILGLKMVCAHNSGSAVKIFLNFAQ